MHRMGIQSPPERHNHEDEARELSAILTGIRMLIEAKQMPDEWSRYRAIDGLRTISQGIRHCPQGEVHLQGHKQAADWCEHVADLFIKGDWSRLSETLVSQGDQYFHVIDGCTSPLIMY